MRFITNLVYIKIIALCTFIVLVIALSPSCGVSKKMRVGVLFDNPPFSFIAPAIIEPRGTLPRGLSVDIANMLLDKMDLPIAEVYPMDDLGLIEALNNGHIDMIVGIFNDSYISADLHLIETDIKVNRTYFVNLESPTITNYTDLPGKTVAIEKGRSLMGLLPSETNIDFIETQSQKEALALVDSGEAQVYISDNNISTIYIIQKEGFRNIKEVNIPIETVPLVIVVHDRDQELITSLKTAYDKSFEDKDYYSSIHKWISKDFGYSESMKKGVDYFLGGDYIQSILTTVMISIFVILGIIFWNYMLKRKVLLVTKNLQISEQKYKHLIESSPDMIHLISRSGEIRLANQIALRHLEYSKEEMTSLKLHYLVPYEQAKDLTIFIDKVFQDKYSNEEFTFIAKNGNRINVEMVATILKEANTSENLACCFSRDLTERKRLEEELIHSDRLAIMGRMAAGIAHEINNPLGIILTNTEEMLNYEVSKEDSYNSLKSIERNALRAAKIIDDLLTFTRPAPLRAISIRLAQIIDNSLLFLKHRLKQKNISVEKIYPPDLVFSGDENLIQQLLINLILNSIQAIKGKGMIMLRADLTGEGDNRKIFLEIEDSGIGIPKEDFKKIFDPFFTSRKENGFGLGLFISKIIVEKHDGSITARSRTGKGTVMRVELPLKSTPPMAD